MKIVGALVILGTAALIGFAAGFIYGIDRAKAVHGSQMRAWKAEARECRQMALNLSTALNSKMGRNA